MIRRLIRSLTVSLAAVLVGAVAPASNADASDLGDSPTTAARPSADLGDAYFFLAPNAPNFVILAATLRGYIVPAQNANLGFFDPKVALRFQIENTGDAKPDETIDVTFGPRTSPDAPQIAKIKLPSGSFTAPTTISRGAFGSTAETPVVTADPASGVVFFAGLIDDPLFFDLAAFEAYLPSRLANMTNPAILTRGRDSFSGYNTMAVVLGVPVNSLLGDAGSVIGLSVSLKASGGFKDRVAHPLINSALIGYDHRVAYNGATTAQDAKGKFAPEIVAKLQALQTDAPSIALLRARAVDNGDILRLDTSIANTGTEGGKNVEARYPNGRRPNDDVVEDFLTLINSGVPAFDAVSDNDVVMRDFFPFFALPHQPFPVLGDDHTRN